MPIASSLSEAFVALTPLVRGLLGFGLGAVIGSFLAALFVRWPDGRSALRGRSACDNCGARLPPSELVPIVSYLVLRGRCRRCGSAIDPGHLVIEVAAGVVGAVALAAHSMPLGLVTALFGWWLLLLAALDARHHWLPDLLTLPLIAAGLVFAVIDIGPALDLRLVGAAAGFVALWGIGFLYARVRRREGLGGGDPKLLAALGGWLGWHQLPFVLLGAGLLGLAALLATRLRGQTISATDRLPLGALMALAAWPIWLLSAQQ